jgi:hypothetical protein
MSAAPACAHRNQVGRSRAVLCFGAQAAAEMTTRQNGRARECPNSKLRLSTDVILQFVLSFSHHLQKLTCGSANSTFSSELRWMAIAADCSQPRHSDPRKTGDDAWISTTDIGAVMMIGYDRSLLRISPLRYPWLSSERVNANMCVPVDAMPANLKSGSAGREKKDDTPLRRFLRQSQNGRSSS